MSDDLNREVTSAERDLLDAVDPELYPLFSDLHSTDPETAKEALFLLRVKVCTQGVAINRSTAITVPIIVRSIFGDNAVRLGLLDLLLRIQKASHAWRKAARIAKPEYAPNYREKIEWELAVDSALRETVPDLEAIRLDFDTRISFKAGELLDRIRS